MSGFKIETSSKEKELKKIKQFFLQKINNPLYLHSVNHGEVAQLVRALDS